MGWSPGASRPGVWSPPPRLRLSVPGFPHPAPRRWPGDVVAAATPPLLGVTVPTPGPRAGRRSRMASPRVERSHRPCRPEPEGNASPLTCWAVPRALTPAPAVLPLRGQPPHPYSTASGTATALLPAAATSHCHQPLQHPVQRRIGHRAPHPQPTSGCLTHAR